MINPAAIPAKRMGIKQRPRWKKSQLAKVSRGLEAGLWRDLRPRLSQQSGRHGVTSREGTGDHGAIEHGDEEDLRVEEGAEGIDKSVPTLAPVLLAVQELDVVLPGTRLVGIVFAFDARNAV